MSLRKVFFLILLVMIICAGLVVFYFKGNRTNLLNTVVNQFFADHPAIRWGVRGFLVSAENVILLPVAVINSGNDKLPSYQLTISQPNLDKLNTNLPADKF